MRRALFVLGVLVAVAAVAGSGWGSVRPQGWKLINLDKLARHRFHAYVGIEPIPQGESLASDGTVYWTAYQSGSDGTTLEVFRWRNGVMADLGSPGPNLTIWTVNDREQFLVVTTAPDIPYCPPPPGKPGCRQPPSPPFHTYLWEQGKLTDLGSLGGTDTAASAIDDQGQIAGSSQVGKGMHAPSHAFLWDKGKMIDLGTLGGRGSSATAINDHGQVIGTSQTTDGAVHGFIWEHGKMTDVGAQPVAIFAQPWRSTSAAR
jgi:probable HAF family extracellular repeat protein